MSGKENKWKKGFFAFYVFYHWVFERIKDKETGVLRKNKELAHEIHKGEELKNDAAITSLQKIGQY